VVFSPAERRRPRRGRERPDRGRTLVCRGRDLAAEGVSVIAVGGASFRRARTLDRYADVRPRRKGGPARALARGRPWLLRLRLDLEGDSCASARPISGSSRSGTLPVPRTDSRRRAVLDPSCRGYNWRCAAALVDRLADRVPRRWTESARVEWWHPSSLPPYVAR
jgi:hypothetical protein